MKRYKVIIGKQTTYDILANNEVSAEEEAWKLYRSSPVYLVEAKVIEVKEKSSFSKNHKAKIKGYKCV